VRGPEVINNYFFASRSAKTRIIKIKKIKTISEVQINYLFLALPKAKAPYGTLLSIYAHELTWDSLRK
jgi:hypothetical protein